MTSTISTPESADPPAAFRRLSAWRGLGWGAGGGAENLIVNGLLVLLLPIYNIGMGVDAVWVGWVLAFPRIMDMVVTPLVGNLSDNTRTRWGRRKPWMVCGVIIAAFCFVMIWFPPLDWSSTAKLAWLMVFSIIYYAAFDFFSVPYNALGIEVSGDYNDRTRIQSYRSFFILGTGLATAWVYKLCFLPVFVGASVDGIPDEVLGVRRVGILYAAVILVFGLIPVLACKENSLALRQSRISIWKSLGLTFHCGVFWVYTFFITFSLLGVIICSPLAAYVIVFHVAQGDKSLGATIVGISGTLAAVVGMASVPFLRAFAYRFGKKNAVLLGQVLLMAGAGSSWFYMQAGHPWLAVAGAQILAVAIAMFMMLGNTILADICDIDELRTHTRREGVFSGIFTMTNKTTFAVGTLLSGYLVTWSGFLAGSAAPSAESIHHLRLLYAVGPCICAGLAMIATIPFPITRESAAEVQRQLRLRNVSETQGQP